MIPYNLRIKNFGPFKDEQVFTFPEEPGLYFLQGDNQVEPALGSNGAGKSSLWAALYWLCFEKTPRGLKAGAASNWDMGKGTRVELSFLSNSGEECMVTRTWSPNSWTLTDGDGNHEDLTKSKSNAFLGWLALEAEPFLTSVLMAQTRPMFLDLKREAQAQLFSDVLGLDKWLERSERASRKASDQDAITRQRERELATMQGELRASGDDGKLRASMEAWEKDWQRRLGALERAYEIQVNAGDYGALPDPKELEAQELVLRAVWKEAMELTDRLKAGLKNPSDALDLLLHQLSGIEALLARTERDLEALGKGGRCPTCGQATGPAHRGPIREERDKLTGEIAKLEREIGSLTKHLEGRKQSYEHARDAEAEAKDDLDAKARQVVAARRELLEYDRELDRLEDAHEELKKEVNPFAAMNATRRREIDALEDAIEAKQQELDDSTWNYSLYSYWVRGFKEIRLQHIAQALNELEIEVNSGCEALGLHGWELRFRVDRETKSGNIQRGFSVFVKSPHNDHEVPWEAWSGGESQRLRIAGNMGLSDLIRSRTGATIPLEIWDEPTQGLSPKGVTDLLQSLAQRAVAEQRVIWVTDHRSHDFGGFAGSALITKTKAGSIITQ